MILASESNIAEALGRIAIDRRLAIERPKKNVGYTVMKADGPKLENAVSIWDGKITFYSGDKSYVDSLRKSGYSVSEKPYRAQPSDDFRFELTNITSLTFAQGKEDFAELMRRSASFVSSYRTPH